MIRAEPRDDLGAVGLAAACMQGARDLEGELVRFAAGVGEGEDRLVADHDLRQALGEFGDVDVRDAGVEGDELEFPDLVGDALRHLGAAMADLAGAEMAAGVEQAVALLVEDIGALAADDHLRIAVGILALEGGEVGEEMADVALRALTGGSAGPGRRRLRESSSSACSEECRSGVGQDRMTKGSWTSSESSHHTLLVWRYWSIASMPFWRPMPLDL